MLSVIELVYVNPDFASPGTPFPNKKGVVNSKINGRVRYASSYSFTEENNIKQCSNKQYSCTYANDGRILHKTVCNQHGKLIELTTYEYTEKGLVSDILTIDSKGNQKVHYVFNYNRNDLLYTYEWIDEENISCGKHVFLYDTNQNVIEERWDSRTPENRWKREYIYNENNQEIEFREYKGALQRFSRKNLRTYDEFGNLIKHVYIDHKGVSEDLPTCKFDEQGKCIEHRTFNYGHPDYIKYDISNKVVEIIQNQKQFIKIIYNEPNSITLLWFDKETFSITKKRDIQFDKYKNIISIINFEGENLEKITGTLFSYEYYPD